MRVKTTVRPSSLSAASLASASGSTRRTSLIGSSAATMRCLDGPVEFSVLTSTSPCAVQPSTLTPPFSKVIRFGRPPSTGIT